MRRRAQGVSDGAVMDASKVRHSKRMQIPPIMPFPAEIIRNSVGHLNLIQNATKRGWVCSKRTSMNLWRQLFQADPADDT
jgi:hypothetical protein